MTDQDAGAIETKNEVVKIMDALETREARASVLDYARSITNRGVGMATAVNMMSKDVIDTQKQKTFWKKIAVGASVGFIITVAVLFGLMVASAELTKETYASCNDGDCVLQDKNGIPLQVESSDLTVGPNGELLVRRTTSRRLDGRETSTHTTTTAYTGSKKNSYTPGQAIDAGKKRLARRLEDPIDPEGPLPPSFNRILLDFGTPRRLDSGDERRLTHDTYDMWWDLGIKCTEGTNTRERRRLEDQHEDDDRRLASQSGLTFTFGKDPDDDDFRNRRELHDSRLGLGPNQVPENLESVEIREGGRRLDDSECVEGGRSLHYRLKFRGDDSDDIVWDECERRLEDGDAASDGTNDDSVAPDAWLWRGLNDATPAPQQPGRSIRITLVGDDALTGR